MRLEVVGAISGPVEEQLVLREVFDYEFAEIARIVEKTDDNCRQILRRARQRVGARGARFEPAAAAQDELVDRFFQTVHSGDMAENVLAAVWTDEPKLFVGKILDDCAVTHATT